jgi:hypothetical protein
MRDSSLVRRGLRVTGCTLQVTSCRLAHPVTFLTGDHFAIAVRIRSLSAFSAVLALSCVACAQGLSPIDLRIGKRSHSTP